jgi:hypothetical protein
LQNGESVPWLRPALLLYHQGAIILGIGGDNSDGAVGTFYEVSHPMSLELGICLPAYLACLRWSAQHHDYLAQFEVLAAVHRLGGTGGDD